VKVQAVYDTPTAIRRVLTSGTGLAGLSFGSGDLAAQRSSLLSALSSFPGAAS